ncbi:ribosome hibernation-promoting factor, HPF/YfiA family [Hominifimenecus sp. rT4P-3]|uniref:ribosome hibernation-promoting factor, HPF/YfiA family n=1 Tax=Hominifimenecus sp. rT4P-3 TaxID=3242979 RepID=UPI003DA3E2B3
MRFIVAGKNIDLTPGLQEAIDTKLKKLEKYFNSDTEAQVTLSVEKGRQKIEVTIPVKGRIIRAEEVSEDMYTSIDLVQETIERQLKKYKNKLIDSAQSAASFSKEYTDEPYEEEESIQIVKTKRFAVKPMDAEEACLQMEMLGHNFYVFRDADTDQVNVVYKRKNGTYGLIEPEF